MNFTASPRTPTTTLVNHLTRPILRAIRDNQPIPDTPWGPDGAAIREDLTSYARTITPTDRERTVAAWSSPWSPEAVKVRVHDGVLRVLRERYNTTLTA